METEYIEKQLVLSKSQQDYLEGRYDYDDFVLVSDIESIPPADVRPAAEILNAVDEAIIFLNNASHQMPYHVYSALYDLIYEICPNCGADMRGGDAE